MGVAKGDVGVIEELPTARASWNTKHRNHRYTEPGRRREKAAVRCLDQAVLGTMVGSSRTPKSGKQGEKIYGVLPLSDRILPLGA